MRVTSLGRLPGQNADGRRRIGTSAAAFRNAARGADGRARSTSGWPTNSHRHAAFAIDRLFERKDHQHEIRELADGLDPLGAPGPDLRADVVDDRNAERLDAPRQTKVEIGKIDDDERVGPVGARPRDELAESGIRARNLPDRFRQPRHREVAIVLEEGAARGRELRSAEPADGNAPDRSRAAHESARPRTDRRTARRTK